jgi:hypothetical protein
MSSEMMSQNDFDQYQARKLAAILPHVRRLLAQGKTQAIAGGRFDDRDC